MNPPSATSAGSGYSHIRNGRGKSGRLTRKTITPTICARNCTRILITTSAAITSASRKKQKTVAIPPITSSETYGKRSEEHTSELQSRLHLVCRLLLEKKKKKTNTPARSEGHDVVLGDEATTHQPRGEPRQPRQPPRHTIRLYPQTRGVCRPTRHGAYD